VDFRKVQRANLAHYRLQNSRHPWIRPCPRATTKQYRRTIRLDDHLLSRYLRCQQYHPRLGRYRLFPNPREEGRYYRHDDLDLECFIHLHTLSLPSCRCTQVRFGDGRHGCLFAPLHALCLGHEVRSQEAEQDSCPDWCYHYLPLLGLGTRMRGINLRDIAKKNT
jgi:hypothetical protein